MVKATQLGLAPGSLINGFNAAVTQTSDPLVIGAGATATIDEMPNGLARTGSYIVQANAICAPNAIPIAALSASPLTGDAPLTVDFNASGSSDPDAGDSIVSYTFNFGDGSPEVTQLSSMISHPYTDHGNFRATVRVKDSHDAVSTNPAEAVIQVGLPLDRIDSRKLHGPGAVPFDIPLPVDGTTRGIKCRTGGANGNFTIIYTFDQDRVLTGPKPTVAKEGNGNVGTHDFGPNANQYTVNLTNVTNEQHFAVTLNGVHDTEGANLTGVRGEMIFLGGDTSADKRVNVTDTNQTKSRSGQTTNNTNKRFDVTLDGRINVTDTNFVKSHSGDSVP